MWPFSSAKDRVPTFPVDNTIGKGTRVRGDIDGPGGFRVDGTVAGAVKADGGVIVGEGGLVEGSLSGRDVVVLGRVRGDVFATGHLEIGPKGKVLGDITVQTFRMHKGGVFRGTSSMPGADDPTPALTAPSSAPPLPAAHRGRTLPPPTGAVPPPPALGEATSQERIITSGKSEARATGS